MLTEAGLLNVPSLKIEHIFSGDLNSLPPLIRPIHNQPKKVTFLSLPQPYPKSTTSPLSLPLRSPTPFYLLSFPLSPFLDPTRDHKDLRSSELAFISFSSDNMWVWSFQLAECKGLSHLAVATLNTGQDIAYVDSDFFKTEHGVSFIPQGQGPLSWMSCCSGP